MAEAKVAAGVLGTTPFSSASLLSALTEEEEEDASHRANDKAEEGDSIDFFASLMPNLFSSLQHCDNKAFDDQQFQQINRLLDSAKSEVDMIHGNPFFGQTCDRKAQEETRSTEPCSQDCGKEMEGLLTKKPMLIRSEKAVGKENASPNYPPQRNKLLRRERSSRVATHRKPFAVDVRSFGSVLNSNEPEKAEKPQDVHAFWEAADERDAAEAIMEKLKGRYEHTAGSETTRLRRLGVRRKNSQRTTTRLKRFALELPLYAEHDRQLDEERLEEEEDTTQESSFTFVSNLGIKALNQACQQEDTMKQVQRSQLSRSPDPKAMDGIVVDEVNHPLGEDVDILSDGKSPTVTSNPKGEVAECSRHSGILEMLDAAQNIRPTNFEISPAACDPKKGEGENSESASLSEMAATPCDRTTALEKTLFMSPTPPSNPLAAFKLRKDTAVEDMSKRRLDFDDSMGLPAPDLELAAPVIQNALLQSLSTSSGPPNDSVLEETLESPEAFIPEGLVPVEATEHIEPIPMEPSKRAIKDEKPNDNRQAHIEPIAMKPSKRATKVKKPIDNRRNSLEGSGMIWENKQRRSTRIRSRPLEWWRGERFLLGRVHKSLATVIGIKYISSSPCLPKRGTKALTFKVKSYVSEEYAKYVEFAALC